MDSPLPNQNASRSIPNWYCRMHLYHYFYHKLANLLLLFSQKTFQSRFGSRLIPLSLRKFIPISQSQTTTQKRNSWNTKNFLHSVPLRQNTDCVCASALLRNASLIVVFLNLYSPPLHYLLYLQPTYGLQSISAAPHPGDRVHPPCSCDLFEHFHKFGGQPNAPVHRWIHFHCSFGFIYPP